MFPQIKKWLISKKLNLNSKIDEIKTRTGCKKHKQFICFEHYTSHLLDYFEIKEK